MAKYRVILDEESHVLYWGGMAWVFTPTQAVTTDEIAAKAILYLLQDRSISSGMSKHPPNLQIEEVI